MTPYKDETENLGLGMSQEQFDYHMRLARSAELSPRQRQIVEHIQAGRSTKEIARLLGISPATAKAHTAAVFARLGVPNRVALAGLGLVRVWTDSEVQHYRSGQVRHFQIQAGKPPQIGRNL